MNMKKLFSIVVIGAFLAACGTMSTTALFKPGTGSAQKQRDLDQCKIASLRSIPQAFITTTTGGFYDPGGVSCYSRRYGRTVCNRFGDIYMPPAFFTVDQNDGLRWRFVLGCLQKKGYTIVSKLPACTGRQERQRALAARTMASFTCNPDTRLDY